MMKPLPTAAVAAIALFFGIRAGAEPRTSKLGGEARKPRSGSHLVTVIGHPDRSVFSTQPGIIKKTLAGTGYSHGLVMGVLHPGESPEGNFDFADRTTVVDTTAETVSALKFEAARVQPGGTLVLNVGDHGTATGPRIYGGFEEGQKVYHKPEQTGIAVSPSAFVSWPKVIGAVRESMPQGTSLKVIAASCFSGGVHAAVAKTPNSCAIAASDYQSPAWGSMVFFIDDFHDAVAEQIRDVEFDADGSGKSSLLEAYLYAEEQQMGKNEARSTLSSFDFVESWLKEGVHDGQRTVYSKWYEDTGATVEGCRNSKLGTLIVDASAFKSFEEVVDAMDRADSVADWNLVPEGLRKVVDAAIQRRELSGLASADRSLDEKSLNNEIRELRKDWAKARSDANPAVKAFNDFASGPYKNFAAERDRLEAEAQILESEERMLSDRRTRAVETLQGAWFFKDSKREQVRQTTLSHSVAAEKAKNARARVDDWKRGYSDVESAYARLEEKRNQSLASEQKRIRESFEKLKKQGTGLKAIGQRAAVLRQRLNRVARFMATAPKKVVDQYLSILRCELEDL